MGWPFSWSGSGGTPPPAYGTGVSTSGPVQPGGANMMMTPGGQQVQRMSPGAGNLWNNYPQGFGSVMNGMRYSQGMGGPIGPNGPIGSNNGQIYMHAPHVIQGQQISAQPPNIPILGRQPLAPIGGRFTNFGGMGMGGAPYSQISRNFINQAG